LDSEKWVIPMKHFIKHVVCVSRNLYNEKIKSKEQRGREKKRCNLLRWFCFVYVMWSLKSLSSLASFFSQLFGATHSLSRVEAGEAPPSLLHAQFYFIFSFYNYFIKYYVFLYINIKLCFSKIVNFFLVLLFRLNIYLICKYIKFYL
jgi:hypothetical protein